MTERKAPVRGRPRPVEAPPARGSVGAAAGAAGRFCRRRPGMVLGVAAVLGCGGAVAYNAMTQPGKHPAPLFGKAAPTPEPPRRPEIAAAAIAAPTPLPTRRPDPVAAVAQPPQPEPPTTAAARPSDPIGAMIRAGDPKPAPEASRVAAAQKALTRLGYGPLRADGQVGATTRQALEQFERDQKLPATGTLAPRTLKQLAALAGQPIE